MSSGVVDCLDHLTEGYPMNDEEDLNAEGIRLMEVWHEYGKTFNSFVPEEQPFPNQCDLDLPGPGEKGRLSPQALKHWEILDLSETLQYHSRDVRAL
jgi:hypothetical protein